MNKLNKTAKPNRIYLKYMYKEDLAVYNPLGLICHKNQPTQT